MHCTDEEMIAHLDGELGWVTSIRVRSHLKRCWRCRSRVDSYEREIYSFIEITDQWSFPDVEWKTAAKWRLNESFRGIEEMLSKQRVSPFRSVKLAWEVALAVSLCFVMLPFHKVKNPVPNEVLDTVARAAAAEEALFRAPVQEVLAVEIEQIRPKHTIRRSRLEAWSDQANGRFASRWSSENGTLKLAAWKPQEGSELIYHPSSSLVTQRIPSDHHSKSLASLADNGLDPTQVETAFMQWMQARSWQPISLSADFSTWSKQDGTVMHMERRQLPDGSSVIQVVAQRANRQSMLAILTVELEADTYRPRLQTLLLQDASHEIQVRLAVTSIQEISASRLTVNPFFSSPSLLREVNPSLSSKIRDFTTPSESPLPVPSSEVVTKQVEARYAFHKAGACLGLPVEVSETPHGVLVRTRAEENGFSGVYEADGAQLKDMLASLADLRNIGSLPVESLNTDYLSDPERIIKQHISALQLLARDFGEHQTLSLSERSWELLEEMIRDHTAAIRAQLDTLGPQWKENTTVIAPGRSWQEISRLLGEQLGRLSQLPNRAATPEAVWLVNLIREEVNSLQTTSKVRFSSYAPPIVPQ